MIGVVEGIRGGYLCDTTVAIEHKLKALNYTLGFETISGDDDDALNLPYIPHKPRTKRRPYPSVSR